MKNDWALAIVLLIIVSILHSWRMAVLARAIRENAQLVREAFESIAYVCQQLNATPGERARAYDENLERLRLMLIAKQHKKVRVFW